MANDTKERILVAALEMFSQNGYAGTNIRELSAYRALGCSFAEEINEELAAAEPFDVQLEYKL